MKIRKQIHWLIYPLFLLACARQTTPTGGPKDSIPPRLVNSYPKQGATNFKEKTVELTFDEDVALNNPKEQLIITPALSKDPTIKTKKEKVTITFEEDLKDSSTYSINFRESIQDITEKNPAEMLKLAFSTGSYIDSLSIEGYVYNLLTSADVKDATIALYESDTFQIFKNKPTYITKSDPKGKFKFENLKPGLYQIYGMEDKSKNLIVDSKTESYGFLKDSIALDKKLEQIKIPLVRLDSRPLKLTSARPYGTYFNIKTTKNIVGYKITNPAQEPIIACFGEDQSNVRIYNTLDGQDSLQVRFEAVDSISNTIDTTFYIKFSNRNAKPENFTSALQDFDVIVNKTEIRGSIKFNKPILQINFDSIFYRIDSVHTVRIANKDLSFDSLNNILYLKKSFDKTLLPVKQEKDSRLPNVPAPKKVSSNDKPPDYQLYFGTGAFISIELDSSKRTVETIKPTQLEDTGIIFVNVDTKAPHWIVQLLTKDFKLIAAIPNTKRASFEDLKPGDYQIRLIIDSNNDGKWSPGNFYKKEEPEPIIVYRNEKKISIVNLKANWELGPLLITH
jgi:uncharacterized protein (DUF2141 family)